MAIVKFPPLEEVKDEGPLAVGGDLEVSSLLLAYRQGIFPWPISPEAPLAWFSPDPRGVFHTNHVHIPRSLRKVFYQKRFQITFNQQFSQVIQECSRSKRKNQKGSWITQEMVEAYIQLHHCGYAYSVETWLDGLLVGGVYGVQIGQFFSGESMFFKETDASKVALISLLKQLQQHQIPLLDVQMITSVTHLLGAKNIPRSLFIKKLQELLSSPPIPDVFEKNDVTIFPSVEES